MIVIGLAGRARSGKDTVADRLVAAHGFTKIAFADPVREMAAAINPMISLDGAPPVVQIMLENFGAAPMLRYTELLDALGYEQAKTIPDFRRFLQRVGTEGVRDVLGDDTWTNMLLKRTEQRAHSRYVVPDVRFHNEVNCLTRARQFTRAEVWRITRPGVSKADTHASESAIEQLNVTAELHNGGTLEDLYQRIDAFVLHSL